MNNGKENPLGYEKIGQLVLKFTIPAMTTNVISMLYNLVDQVFIGQGVGLLGNAATNVVFPITILCIALQLLGGIGGASNFSLCQGAGKEEEAKRIAGCALSWLLVIGLAVMAVNLIFLHPLMILFGATENVLPYAKTYAWITALGIPMYILGLGGSNLVRADGAPKYSMAIGVAGAVINTVLDAVFIVVFHMGIAGAAWATVIGQWFSGLMLCYYFLKRSNIKLSRKYYMPSAKLFLRIAKNGLAGSILNLSLAASQIVLNNMLRKYGAASVYGVDIPLACVGIITKVNQLFMAICMSLHHGCQPIIGFNYGARKYQRSKEAYKIALITCLIIGAVFLLIFELLPGQVMSIFVNGNEEYYAFSIKFFRIYLMFAFVNGAYNMTSGFFTSIGKSSTGVWMAVIKWIILLIPLTIILPVFVGIDGVMWAAPVTDFLSMFLGMFFVVREFRRMTALSLETS